jgi:DNA-binding XRE family transcriptional regulator
MSPKDFSQRISAKITIYCDFACFLHQKFVILPQNHIIMLFSEIGTVVKNRRKALGITQPRLAELADISINTLYKIERGEANPSIKILLRIVGILGMDLSIDIKQAADE